MTFSIDLITLNTNDAVSVTSFYSSAFSLGVAEGKPNSLNLHGVGQLAVEELEDKNQTASLTAGFSGFVMALIVNQPSDVDALLSSVVDVGGSVIKPAKKQLFGDYSAVFRAPEGTIWKVSAASKKNRVATSLPVRPKEAAVFLGVDSPEVSKTFYEALGMKPRHDYGDKFVDFEIAPGTTRLGLLPRKGLAKDVGAQDTGDDSSALLLSHRVASRDELDRLLALVKTAGGQRNEPIRQTEQGAYVASFADPDGNRWKITAGE